MKPLITICLLLFLQKLTVVASTNEEIIAAFPSPGDNETIVYISAAVGQQNISVECVIQLSGAPVFTQWRNKTSGVSISFSTVGGSSLDPNFEFLSASPTTNSEVTISSFTSDLDRFRLECYRTKSVTFLFGIPIITLLNASEVYNVTEFQDFTLDLTNYKRTSFPPRVQSVWRIDGKTINTSQQEQYGSVINTTTYSIAIGNINRTYSGRVVNLTVSNTAGAKSTEFILNIVYQPEVVVGIGEFPIYASINDTVNITAAERIDGNPVPLNTWRDPNNNIINFIGRFSQPIMGTLMIEKLQPSDFGEYRFEASNGVGNNAEISVSLVQLIQPSQPRNLSYNVSQLTRVDFRWNPPLVSGMPSYFQYVITISSDKQETVQSTTKSTSYSLEDLYPGTLYNVFVSAASSFFTSGGERSEIVSFTTDRTTPVVGSVRGTSFNGSIHVQWSLMSTGGVPAEKISVSIECAVLSTSDGSRDSIDECTQGCIDPTSLNGSRLVGPVHAGFKYRCRVVFRNEVGFQGIIATPSSIDTFTGIPSSPSVTVIDTGLHLITRFTGVVSIINFAFNVIILSTDNKILLQTLYKGSNNTVIDTNELSLPSGNYTVEVTSKNQYGVSDKTTERFTALTSTEPSNSTTATTKNEINLALAAGGGGAVLAVVLVVVIVIIAIVAVTLHRRMKFNSVTFVANDTLPVKKRFDRPRIPSVGSTVLYQ